MDKSSVFHYESSSKRGIDSRRALEWLGHRELFGVLSGTRETPWVGGRTV